MPRASRLLRKPTRERLSVTMRRLGHCCMAGEFEARDAARQLATEAYPRGQVQSQYCSPNDLHVLFRSRLARGESASRSAFRGGERRGVRNEALAASGLATAEAGRPGGGTARATNGGRQEALYTTGGCWVVGPLCRPDGEFATTHQRRMRPGLRCLAVHDFVTTREERSPFYR